MRTFIALLIGATIGATAIGNAVAGGKGTGAVHTGKSIAGRGAKPETKHYVLRTIDSHGIRRNIPVTVHRP